MSKVTASEFYARAIFEMALGESKIEKWRFELRKVADVTADAELMASLEKPGLSFDARRELLQGRLGDISPSVLRLVFLLLSMDKLEIITDISREYDRLLAYYGIEHVEVVVALPLDEEDMGKISSHLEQLTGRKFAVDVRVDPAIVGGLKIRIGDTVIDASLRGKLEAMREDLVKAVGS